MDEPQALAFSEKLAQLAFSRDLPVDPYGPLVFNLSFVTALRDLRRYYVREEEQERRAVLGSLRQLVQEAGALGRAAAPARLFLEEAVRDLEDRRAALERHAWTGTPIPDELQGIPCMLDEETRRYYVWLAGGLSGAGDVLELGCWLGGSTLCLATGLGGNPRFGAGRRYQAVDRFRWEPWMTKHLARHPAAPQLAPGDSFRRAFERFCASRRGLFETVEWNGFRRTRGLPWDPAHPRDLELVVYDVTQDYDTMTAFWERLRPRLIAGRSILVLNTYGSPRSDQLRRFCRETRHLLRAVHKPRGSAKGFLFAPT
jgi:hypothetical protein